MLFLFTWIFPKTLLNNIERVVVCSFLKREMDIILILLIYSPAHVFI